MSPRSPLSPRSFLPYLRLLSVFSFSGLFFPFLFRATASSKRLPILKCVVCLEGSEKSLLLPFLRLVRSLKDRANSFSVSFTSFSSSHSWSDERGDVSPRKLGRPSIIL